MAARGHNRLLSPRRPMSVSATWCRTPPSRNADSRLQSQVDGGVEVTGAGLSEANSAVYMVVGGNSTPWKCLVAADGSGDPYLEFMGTDGAL